MQDFIVDNVVCGKLRGSSISSHDVLPYLEGTSSVTTNVGTFSNTVFYNGPLFKTVPSGKHIKFVTNCGDIYYLPASSISYSFSFASDFETSSQSSYGFSLHHVSPYLTHQVIFNTPSYSFEQLQVLLLISNHSTAYYFDSSYIHVSLSSFPSLSSQDLQSISLSFSLPSLPISGTYSLSLTPCVTYSNFQVSSSSFTVNNNSVSYSLLSSFTLSFSILVSSISSLLPFLSNYLISYNNRLYYLSSSINFIVDYPEPQEVQLEFTSIDSIVSHILH